MEEVMNKYGIECIEEGMSEKEWEGWKKVREGIGDGCEVVGDELFVRNVELLWKGIEVGCGNWIVMKVNEIGCLSERVDGIEMGDGDGYSRVSCDGWGEREDGRIGDIGVGRNSGEIKSG